MSLPTAADFKTWARVETAAEDALITALLAEVVGKTEMAVGKSLTHETVTWYDDAPSLSLYGAPTSILLRYTPVDATTLVLTDGEGAVVPVADYRVRQDIGMLQSVGGIGFGNGPYVITCVAGFDTSVNYAYRELPMIRRVILDWTAMLYQQRTPGARAEGASGTRVEYETDAQGIPKRICADLAKLRGIVYGR